MFHSWVGDGAFICEATTKKKHYIPVLTLPFALYNSLSSIIILHVKQNKVMNGWKNVILTFKPTDGRFYLHRYELHPRHGLSRERLLSMSIDGEEPRVEMSSLELWSKMDIKYCGSDATLYLTCVLLLNFLHPYLLTCFPKSNHCPFETFTIVRSLIVFVCFLCADMRIITPRSKII